MKDIKKVIKVEHKTENSSYLYRIYVDNIGDIEKGDRILVPLHGKSSVHPATVSRVYTNHKGKTWIEVRDNFKPCLYVWTTESYRLNPNGSRYKVGVVNWQSVQNRLKQTDTTGVIEKIELVEIFELDSKSPEDTMKVEYYIHNHPSLTRIRKDREGVIGDYVTQIKPVILEAIAKFNVKKAADIPSIMIPRYYQSDCVEENIQAFQEHDRITDILTCSSGKSYLGFLTYTQGFVLGNLKVNKNIVLLFVPNIQLVRQTSNDWITAARSSGLSLRSITVGGVKGSIQDPTELAARIEEATKDSITLITCTYQSSGIVSTALKITDTEVDLTICDEVHRLTGSNKKVWSNVLYNHFIKSRKRLFFTASPVEYTEASFGYSGLENKEKYGPTVFKYSFRDLQLDGYAAPLELLGVELDKDVYLNLQDSFESKKNIIQENLLNFQDISLTEIPEEFNTDEGSFVFFIMLHNTLISLRDGLFTHPLIYANSHNRLKIFMAALKTLAPDYNVNIDYLEIFSSGDDIDSRINKLKKDFTNAKIGVAGNVYCLQEGISINAVDGIVLIDPRSSGPAIVQILGRPVRLDSNNPNKVARVLLPILLEKSISGTKLHPGFHKTSMEWILALAAADSDFENIILEDMSFISSKKREGIDEREAVLNHNKKAIPRGREKKRTDVILDKVDFEEFTKTAVLKKIISTKSNTLVFNQTEEGKLRKISRDAHVFINKHLIPLENGLYNYNTRNQKKYTELIKSKYAYTEEFSIEANIGRKDAERILIECGLKKLLEVSTKLDVVNTENTVKSLFE